jgi:ankyrin repeat protein
VISVNLLFLSYFSPQNGDTALHIASKNGHPEVVKLLVQSHADVNIKDRVSTESLYTPFTVNLEFFAVEMFALRDNDHNDYDERLGQPLQLYA